MSKNSERTHTLYISGIHCSACKHLVEDILKDDDSIVSATVSLSDETLIVITRSPETLEELAVRLSLLFKKTRIHIAYRKACAGERET